MRLEARARDVGGLPRLHNALLRHGRRTHKRHTRGYDEESWCAHATNASTLSAFVAQMINAARRDKYKCSPPGLLALLDEAALVGLFPHGKARTRGAPGVKDLGVRSRFGTQPFEQIENQILDGFFAHLPSSAMRAFTSFSR